MIFAREISDSLTSLVKKIDAQTENTSKKLCSFIVFLSDDEGMGDKLKAWAEKNNIKKLVVSTDNVAGPKGYNINKDADVTVVLYNNRKVAVNHAYKKGELNSKAVEQVISELPQILK